MSDERETPNPYDAMPQACPRCKAPKTAANHFECGSLWLYTLAGQVPPPQDAQWRHTLSCRIRVVENEKAALAARLARLEAVAERIYHDRDFRVHVCDELIHELRDSLPESEPKHGQ